MNRKELRVNMAVSGTVFVIANALIMITWVNSQAQWFLMGVGFAMLLASCLMSRVEK